LNPLPESKTRRNSGTLESDHEKDKAMKNKTSSSHRRWLLYCAIVWAVLTWIAALDTWAAETANVRLVGTSDLQGRATLQIALKGNYAYVGHHKGNEMNPLTGKVEPNGTSIIDVSNPVLPKIIAHIPGYKDAESRAVQVAEKVNGKDYLLRNQESPEFTGFEIWEITDRANPKLVSKIGPLLSAHKSWWDAMNGFGYLSGAAPGWSGSHLIIYDLRNPEQPKFVANWGLPGQAPGKQVPSGSLVLHHPVVSGDRAYLSYSRGGDMVVLDIRDRANPKLISHIDFSPPFSSIHTTLPLIGIKVPNFTKGRGDIRNFLLVSEEAGLGENTCQELRKQIYVVDNTDEAHPLPVATYKVPDGDFCDRGGRFGPHQFAETKDGEILAGNLIFVAYFSAGLRVVDISDPFKPKEVGFYIPETTEKTKPLLKRVIQTNDVDLDYRGLIYITDRAGTGMHILEFIGKTGQAASEKAR
jgi:hypothetical protein